MHVHVLVQNWWALALRGLFAIIFGLLSLVWPGLSLAALVLLFGAYALVDGIFALIAAVRRAEAHMRWAQFAWEGVFGVAAGVVTFFWPGMTALLLLYFIAAWAVLTGIFKIAAAIRLRKEITDEWALGLNGVASIIFGIVLIVFPGAGALALIWLIGGFALLFGVLLLALALRLRRHPTPMLSHA
jgi:uncharacterized membrane protein HdeD (DUF308 family)